MENQLTEIICILDRSGSMQPLRTETVNAINTFIRKQQRIAGMCKLSLVQFNHDLNLTFARKTINDVEQLHVKDYEPFGYTALYDAIGLTLNRAMETLFKLIPSQKPNKVMVFIITDGLENASRFYNRASVKEMIERLETNNGWDFNFFGANIDFFTEATNIGIKKNKTENWNFNEAGLHGMVDKMSTKTALFRNGKV